jgi:hypothetical protein
MYHIDAFTLALYLSPSYYENIDMIINKRFSRCTWIGVLVGIIWAGVAIIGGFTFCNIFGPVAPIFICVVLLQSIFIFLPLADIISALLPFSIDFPLSIILVILVYPIIFGIIGYFMEKLFSRKSA